MNVGLVNNTYSGLTKGSGALSAARQNAEVELQKMEDELKDKLLEMSRK